MLLLELSSWAAKFLSMEGKNAAQASASFEALHLRKEICRVAHKLWERSYVDGNGGNISARLGDKYVLCTPTLMSKGDLVPEDIGLTDMEGRQLAGDRPRTSELLLHLAMYKANPRARSIVHCHPPYATAFGMTKEVPPPGLTPEAEIFVGIPAVAPYETPGGKDFAGTILPFMKAYNSIMLQNHGVVCWWDTPTRAEWLVEVLETSCKMYAIAKQMNPGRPVNLIPDSKIGELLKIKKSIGLPDARFTDEENASLGADGKSKSVQSVQRQQAKL